MSWCTPFAIYAIQKNIEYDLDAITNRIKKLKNFNRGLCYTLTSYVLYLHLWCDDISAT